MGTGCSIRSDSKGEICSRKMRRFLIVNRQASVSRDMILNAIKSNVVEAHSQFAGFVIGQYGDNTPSKIDLKLPSELAKLLDVS